jgi:hypothetical protein
MSWTRISQSNAVEQLQVAAERTVFDLKQTYDLTDPRTKFEIAKDIVAFANNIGGTILVGAIEGNGDQVGRAVRFPGVATGPLIQAIDRAIEMCLPVPVVAPEMVMLSEQDQQRLLGRPGSSSAELLAINVPPMLATPVGAPVCDRNGNRIDHAFRFPIRRAEGTRYLRPEELVFHMNSRERQALLQLVALSPEERQAIRLWSHQMGGGLKPPRDVEMTDIDPTKLVATFQAPLGHEKKMIVATVPLAFVRAIWQDVDGWHLSVEGSVFDLKSDGFSWSGFVPLGAMYGAARKPRP